MIATLAGGVAAARHCVRLLGERHLITFDMGGTSTDIALLQDDEPQLTGEKRVGIARVALPSLDIHRSAREAGRSRGWPAASCTSARRARAPIPAPPVTARAERPPP